MKNINRKLFWIVLVFLSNSILMVSAKESGSPSGQIAGISCTRYTDTPLIKKIAFTETIAPTNNHSTNIPILWKIGKYDGGLQSNSWYFKWCSVFPPESGTKEGDVVGVSKHIYWGYFPSQGGVQIETKRTPDLSKPNVIRVGVDLKAIAAKQKMLELLRFGLPEIKDGTWSWMSTNEFRYSSLPDDIKINGRIEYGVSNRADLVEITVPGDTARTRISYKYRSPSDEIPNSWSKEKVIGEQRQLISTTTIESLELGAEEPGFKGYTFEMFRPENGGIIKSFESNGVSIAVPPELAKSKSEWKRLAMRAQKAKTRYVALLGAFGASLGLLMFVQWLKQKLPVQRIKAITLEVNSPPVPKRPVNRVKRGIIRGKK